MIATPLFSVLTPVYDPPLDVLRETIRSVHEQSFTNWELILVDDCSPNPEVRAVLAEAAALDLRIRVVLRAENGGISRASQTALETARGEFCALLDHDDLLVVDALQAMAEAIAQHPEADYFYSDEDKIDQAGRFYDFFAKPIWSPERLRASMYTSHLSVYRTSLARAVGGFRVGYEGSQDHDLALRHTEQSREIVHIPRILYHWRVVPGSTAADINAKPYAWIAGRKAVQDHLDRVGIAGTAEFGPFPGTYQIDRYLPPERSVSIVIPTRGGSGTIWGKQRCFVVEAVRSALACTDHENLEIVIVADTATPPEVERRLREIAGDKLTWLPFDEPFNFSRKCNLGYLAARGEYVVFLNDDTEVRSEHWLERLVAPLQEPTAGMTGARLYFEDGTVQHGSHIYEFTEFRHAYLGCAADSADDFAALHISREAVGVTAACAAVRRDVFEEVGGFCENLPLNFNDVDLSCKIRTAPYRIVYIAACELFHFESKTRVPVVHPWEVEILHRRWGTYDFDPYLPARYGRSVVRIAMMRSRRLAGRVKRRVLAATSRTQ